MAECPALPPLLPLLRLWQGGGIYWSITEVLQIGLRMKAALSISQSNPPTPIVRACAAEISHSHLFGNIRK